jgi:dTDP-4-dehydrorhamnose reductase
MIWIIGKNGQLSFSFQHELKERGIEFVVSSSKEADVTDKSSLVSFAKEKSISVVINCSAYTAVDKAESDRSKAFLVNKDGARNIAEVCNEIDAFLVHFSTDFVFSGDSRKPYLEGDEPKPINVYGESKLAGEVEIQTTSKKAAIFRVSWLYSPYGNNFYKTMTRLGKEKPALNVVDDQFGSPTYAPDVVKLVLSYVSRSSSVKGVELFHFSNEGEVTWFEFARKIMDLHGYNCTVAAIPSQDYPTPAKRPKYSVMNSEKILKFLNKVPRTWTKSLQECSNFMDKKS